MQACDALRAYLVDQGLCTDLKAASQFHAAPFFRLRIGRRWIPFWPMWGMRRAAVIHDVHHLLTGYDTSYRKELHLAAWELGSGGCGGHVLMCFDRLFVMLFAPLDPVGTWSAFRAGLQCRNLYRWPSEEVLSTDVEQLLEALQPRGQPS